jgi:hypothetical protein
MGLIIAIVIILIVLGVVVYMLSGAAAFKTMKAADNDEAAGVDTLRYHVPTGQDPTVLLAALQEAGYVVSPDLDNGEHVVTIACPQGREQERPKVRAVIGRANSTTLEGPEFDLDTVTFDDEVDRR